MHCADVHSPGVGSPLQLRNQCAVSPPHHVDIHLAPCIQGCIQSTARKRLLGTLSLSEWQGVREQVQTQSSASPACVSQSLQRGLYLNSGLSVERLGTCGSRSLCTLSASSLALLSLLQKKAQSYARKWRARGCRLTRAVPTPQGVTLGWRMAQPGA